MKVQIIVDTSGSMGFLPNDEVVLKEMAPTGSGSFLKPQDVDVCASHYDRTILITDGDLKVPENVEIWQVCYRDDGG